jgi:hypothetical protein
LKSTSYKEIARSSVPFTVEALQSLILPGPSGEYEYMLGRDSGGICDIFDGEQKVNWWWSGLLTGASAEREAAEYLQCHMIPMRCEPEQKFWGSGDCLVRRGADSVDESERFGSVNEIVFLLT